MTGQWINLEVSLPQVNKNVHDKVIDRIKDAGSNINGNYDSNPFTNTIVMTWSLMIFIIDNMKLMQ